MHRRCEIELMCCPCTDDSIETGILSDLVLKLLEVFLFTVSMVVVRFWI